MQRAQRRAERHLVDARPAHAAAQAEEPRAGGLRRADCGRRRRRPRSTMGSTLASVSTLFTTVGLPNRPCLDREGRLVARLAALALDRLEQRGLLAADVGARAAADLDVEGEAARRRCRSPSSPAPRGLVDRAAACARARAGTRRARRGSPSRSRSAKAAMVMASTIANGSPLRSTRSLNVPGSDSSALQTR